MYAHNGCINVVNNKWTTASYRNTYNIYKTAYYAYTHYKKLFKIYYSNTYIILFESIFLSWRLAWSGLNKTINSTIHEISFLSWSWLELIIVLQLNLSKVSRFSSAIQLNELVVIIQIFSWTWNVKLSSFPVQTEILFRMEIMAFPITAAF